MDTYKSFIRKKEQHVKIFDRFRNNKSYERNAIHPQ